MDFITAIKTVFSKYATFDGRARRSEYWWWTLMMCIASFIPFVNLIVALGCLVPSIAVAVRRLHDTGHSGWWFLLALVPIVNLVLIYFFILDSETGSNEFGPNPKGIESYESV